MEQYKTLEVEIKVKNFELPKYFIVIPLTKEEFEAEIKKVSDANSMNNEKRIVVYKESLINDEVKESLVHEEIKESYQEEHKDRIIVAPVKSEIPVIEQIPMLESTQEQELIIQPEPEIVKVPEKEQVSKKGFIKRKINFIERLAGK